MRKTTGDGKGRWRDQEVFISQDGPAACGWPREVHPEDRLTAQKEPEQDSKSRSQGAYGLYIRENITEPAQPRLTACEQNTTFLCLLCGLARIYN